MSTNPVPSIQGPYFQLPESEEGAPRISIENCIAFRCFGLAQKWSGLVKQMETPYRGFQSLLEQVKQRSISWESMNSTLEDRIYPIMRALEPQVAQLREERGHLSEGIHYANPTEVELLKETNVLIDHFAKGIANIYEDMRSSNYGQRSPLCMTNNTWTARDGQMFVRTEFTNPRLNIPYTPQPRTLAGKWQDLWEKVQEPHRQFLQLVADRNKPLQVVDNELQQRVYPVMRRLERELDHLDEETRQSLDPDAFKISEQIHAIYNSMTASLGWRTRDGVFLPSATSPTDEQRFIPYTTYSRSPEKPKESEFPCCSVC